MPSASVIVVGLKAHTGWATLVAVAGPLRAPRIVHRARLDLCGNRFPRFAYHEAAKGKAEAAADAIRTATALSHEAARQSLRQAVNAVTAAGAAVAAAGILAGASKPLPPLACVLASHALIHSAEGVLYRDALSAACHSCRIPVHPIAERELWDSAQHALRLDRANLQRLLDALGRAAGPPWAADQKLAALAALTLLASHRSARAAARP